MPSSFSVGAAMSSWRLSADMAITRSFPAFTCSANSPYAGDAGRNLVAEQCRGRRSAAGESDVADLRGRDAERLGDHADEDVVGAAGRAAGNGNFGGIGFERGRKSPWRS